MSRYRRVLIAVGFRHLGEFAFHGFNLFISGGVLEGACLKDRECCWAVGVVGLFSAVLLVCARRGNVGERDDEGSVLDGPAVHLFDGHGSLGRGFVVEEAIASRGALLWPAVVKHEIEFCHLSEGREEF